MNRYLTAYHTPTGIITRIVRARSYLDATRRLARIAYTMHLATVVLLPT